VISVSRTALSGNELNGALNAAANNNSEPMYRVTVELETQTVAAYGRAQALQSGMLLEADIRQETLHLYEWVLEPLTSLTGKL
jgi:membrane fusion protein